MEKVVKKLVLEKTVAMPPSTDEIIIPLPETITKVYTASVSVNDGGHETFLSGHFKARIVGSELRISSIDPGSYIVRAVIEYTEH